MNRRLFFVGSLPHQTPAAAVAFVEKFSSHLPFLPQLPEANPQEDMTAQVVKGMELGGWDEKCASALELFQNTFNEAPRFKIQVAGPFTLARTLSQSFEATAINWLEFAIRLMRQLRQGAFQGELWLQVDEPSWSLKNPLPPEYVSLFSAVLGSVKGLRLGIHSCASARPEVTAELEKLFRFYSFDYSKTVMTGAESAEWQRRCAAGADLAVGCLTQAGPIEQPHLPGVENRIWLSAPCGLYGWPETALASTFG